ncbi:protein sisterless A [Drosophila guanche]|uniref:Blast:Protein sisterless A n=1 Tax=Drosophila guanche TaxID=7266 RepID=A0A3B0JZT6_DROGU|nr:protein sisterless A [Drosophila guanche]SPP86583.1 blast:Protein sisterless A [Drosophila guanche]
MEQSQLYLHKFYAQAIPRPLLVSSPGLHHPQPGRAAATQQQPEHIDELVALELQQLKTHYADEEQRYVDQMLLANPIVVERRAQPKSETAFPTEATRPVATPSPAPAAATTPTPAPTMPSSRHDTQRQRAESCRKSRYNNKIKKAKLRFRHKFVSSQLTESVGVLDHMREVIAQAEAQLLARGFNVGALERMRRNFGIDRSTTTAMDQ